MHFSERIKELREHNEYTQKQMAEKLGIATVTYVKYERAENEPNYNTLLKLSDIFNVSVDYILGRSNERDIQVYELNETIKYMEKAISILIKDFPDYKDGLMNLVTSFINNIEFIDMLDRLDLLYIKNDISKGINELYVNASDIYDSKYSKNVDISSDLSKLMTNSSQIRKKFDDYITLITSEEYFKFMNESGKIQEPYFKNSINNYK